MDKALVAMLISALVIVSAFPIIFVMLKRHFTKLSEKGNATGSSAKGENKRGSWIVRILAPSVLAMFICMGCLFGTSWAWFASTTTANTTTIKTVSYTVSVSAKQGGEMLPINKGADGVVTLSLEKGKEYAVDIEPTGTATKGYCSVRFENADYYTGQLVSGKLSFTVYSSQDGKLTITPQWGTCAVETQGNVIKNNGSIGTKTAAEKDDTAQDANTPVPTPSAEPTQEPQPTAGPRPSDNSESTTDTPSEQDTTGADENN